jgi:8-oxo-dGTP diphosphatase / 2-hydroxy-dATP diphosphatase
VTKKVFTNCFLVKLGKDNKPVEVCLAMKKRGFGKGMWNGAGGKPQENESVEEAMKREVGEEFGIKLTKYEKCGEFHFFLQKEEMEANMHAFLATKWIGEPSETEEMKPKWFPIKEVPYDEMWKSDSEFLPIIFSGRKVIGKYTFEKEGGMVIKKEIKIVEEF